MQNLPDIREWAKEIAAAQMFEIREFLAQGQWYETGTLRNVIYSGTYHNKPAVLKVYRDRRVTHEPIALAAFHDVNTSSIVRAPQLYASEMYSPHEGWLIMEHLPEGGAFFPAPAGEEEKKEIIEVFVEYRTHFPYEPKVPLSLAEHLPAHLFHRFRIDRWLSYANEQEAARGMRGEELLFDPKELSGRLARALPLIDHIFEKRAMIWCHGHVKAHEIYKTNQGQYYLLDFAHTHRYPEGYELAFLAWADWLMAGDCALPYDAWRGRIDAWMPLLHDAAKRTGLKNADTLLPASLLERTIGTILADVGATDTPVEELKHRLAYLYRFADQLCDEL